MSADIALNAFFLLLGIQGMWGGLSRGQIYIPSRHITRTACPTAYWAGIIFWAALVWLSLLQLVFHLQ